MQKIKRKEDKEGMVYYIYIFIHIKRDNVHFSHTLIFNTPFEIVYDSFQCYDTSSKVDVLPCPSSHSMTLTE